MPPFTIKFKVVVPTEGKYDERLLSLSRDHHTSHSCGVKLTGRVTIATASTHFGATVLYEDCSLSPHRKCFRVLRLPARTWEQQCSVKIALAVPVHRTTSPDAQTRTFSRAYTTAHPHISSVGTTVAQSEKSPRHFIVSHPSRSLVSLLFVPFVRFPSVLSSPPASSSKPSAPTTSVARSCRKSPSAPAPWSESGRVADSVPNRL